MHIPANKGIPQGKVSELVNPKGMPRMYPIVHMRPIREVVERNPLSKFSEVNSHNVMEREPHRDPDIGSHLQEMIGQVIVYIMGVEGVRLLLQQHSISRLHDPRVAKGKIGPPPLMVRRHIDTVDPQAVPVFQTLLLSIVRGRQDCDVVAQTPILLGKMANHDHSAPQAIGREKVRTDQDLHSIT